MSSFSLVDTDHINKWLSSESHRLNNARQSLCHLKEFFKENIVEARCTSSNLFSQPLSGSTPSFNTPGFPSSHLYHFIGLIQDIDPEIYFYPEAGGSLSFPFLSNSNADNKEEISHGVPSSFLELQCFHVTPIPGNNWLYDSSVFGKPNEASFEAATPLNCELSSSSLLPTDPILIENTSLNLFSSLSPDEGCVVVAFHESCERIQLNQIVECFCFIEDVMIYEEPKLLIDSPETGNRSSRSFYSRGRRECSEVEFSEQSNTSFLNDTNADFLFSWFPYGAKQQGKILRVSAVTCLTDSFSLDTIFQNVSSIVRIPQLGLTIDNERHNVMTYLYSFLTDGDELVAEYLLLHLCSRVRNHDISTPVGDLPLCLLCCGLEHIAIRNPKHWSSQLSKILPLGETFLNMNEKFSVISCSKFANKNKTSHNKLELFPIKDHRNNNLLPGFLQLPHGSHLTLYIGEESIGDNISEISANGSDHKNLSSHSENKDYLPSNKTKSQRGNKESTNGHSINVDRLELLNAAIHQQQLSILCPLSSNMEIPTDIQFLTLRKHFPESLPHFPLQLSCTLCWPEGRCSNKKNNFHATVKNLFHFSSYDDPVLIWQIRIYFSKIQSLLVNKERLNEELESVKSDFSDVIERQRIELTKLVPEWNNRCPLIHNNSLHTLLTIAQLIAVSHGRQRVREEDIIKATDLECQRIMRNREFHGWRGY